LDRGKYRGVDGGILRTQTWAEGCSQKFFEGPTLTRVYDKQNYVASKNRKNYSFTA